MINMLKRYFRNKFSKEYDELSKEYKKEIKTYAEKINYYNKIHRAEGYKKSKKIEIPKLQYEKFDKKIYNLLLSANKEKWVDKLREDFPPQTDVFYKLTTDNDKVRDIKKIILINKSEFLAVVNGKVYFCSDHGDFTLIPDIYDIGVCPNKKIFCRVSKKGLQLTKGWYGEEIKFLNWPKVNEGACFLDGTKSTKGPEFKYMNPEGFIPFSDGKKVLISSIDMGVYLIGEDQTKVIYPDKNTYDQARKEMYEDDLNEYLNNHDSNISKEEFKKIEDWDFLDGFFSQLTHCFLSHNNKYIAFGDMFSDHLIYNVDNKKLKKIKTRVLDPHYCIFSKDDSQIFLNSMRFYNGTSFTIKLEEAFDDSNDIEKSKLEVDNVSRVYAGISTSFGYIIGDAQGYIRAIDYNGKYLQGFCTKF